MLQALAGCGRRIALAAVGMAICLTMIVAMATTTVTVPVPTGVSSGKAVQVGPVSVPTFSVDTTDVELGVGAADASCGYWVQTSPNRITSYDYDCTWYFDHNGWYVAGTLYPPNGHTYWWLNRDGT